VVVEALAQAGCTNEGLTLALAIADQDARAVAIGDVLCPILLERGDYEVALQLAREHLLPWGAAYVGATAAVAMVKAGAVARGRALAAELAAQAAETFYDETGQSLLYAQLARAFAALGDSVEAHKCAEIAPRLEASLAGVVVPCWLSNAMADAGDIEASRTEARRAFANLDGLDDWGRANSLEAVSESASRSGAITPAELIGLTRRIENEWARSSAVARIYPRLEGDEVPALLASVGELTNEWAQADALIALASAMATSGDRAGLALALDAAIALVSTWARGFAVGRIAAAAATGAAPDIVSRALTELRGWPIPQWRQAGGLALIAEALGRKGEDAERHDLAKQALDTARSAHVLDEKMWGVHCATLGLALVHLGERAEAEACADAAQEALGRLEGSSRSEEVVNAMIPLAMALHEPERIERMRSFVRASAGADLPVETSAMWAVALAKNGDADRARAEAESIAADPSASPGARGTAACALFLAGAERQALEAVADAMLAARLVGREALDSVLEGAAPGLAHLDRGELLGAVATMGQQVEGWWRGR
jgi:hypothetical protein